MNFIEALLSHQQSFQDAPALFFPDAQTQPSSYAQIDEAITQAIRRLHDTGMVKGDIVALELSNEFLHALLLLACARFGIATLSGSPATLQAEFPVKAVFHDKGTRSAPPSGIPIITIDEAWFRATHAGDGQAVSMPELKPDDLCRIMLTSGSTGSPKPVALTYQMVEERIKAFSYVFGSDFPSYSNILCGTRLSSSLGYAFLFYSFARRGFFCSDSVDFDKIVDAIERYSLQVLITTPFTLAEIVNHCEQPNTRFPRLPLVLTGGSFVSPLLARRIRDRLCQRLVLVYGTTETGVISVLAEDGEIGDVGVPVAGRRVDIIDSAGQVVADGEIGTIRIKASAGPLPFFDLSGWQQKQSKQLFCPGDVGSFNKLGHLVIHGRADNVINIGGTKTTPELLEQSILNAPGIRDCAVVCKQDEFGINRITAFLVLDPYWDQMRFLAYCEAHILRDFLPHKFAVVQKIDRNKNNKIDREALKKLA